MKNKLLLILMVGMFLFSLTFVSSSALRFKQNEVVNYSFVCLDTDNDYCNSGVNCYININAPNGTNLYSNASMIFTDTGFNFVLPTHTLGDSYESLIVCLGTTNARSEFDYEVTPSGSLISSGSGIALIGSLILILVIGIVFLTIANRSEKKAPKVIFYSLSGIIFIMAILYTVVSIQQILYGFENIQSGIETFWFVMKIFVGIAVLALIIIVTLIMIKAWKIKRGYRDE